ncbi:Rieske (2Fe-2S) protein [Flavobacteriaceae bacterium AH-315-B10]|nr:Rieske (2Fe-2S) protein [Flavobacteriaceae bacterium AH-315-B10]
MQRRKFIKSCCYTTVGITLTGSILQSCGSSIYYASVSRNANRLVVKKSEFWQVKKDKKVERSFVLIKPEDSEFPICIYKMNDDDTYVASLLKCTHRGCELNVGGGIYSCPCHGSEFSVRGNVLEGPAEIDLKTFKIETDNEHIYIS